ncbi:MAG: FAD-binding monooxygenase, partial [Gemmatimonadota bacterium]
KSLPIPDGYDLVREAEPLSEILPYRFRANERHHYEALRRFPAGYLVLGDAIASFNPVYGQGMTSAAMQAEALGGELAGGGNGDLWKRFFRRAAEIVDIPWGSAVAEDFRYPETTGEKTPGTDLINAYVARVHRATHHDPVVYGQFLKVMNLMEPPTSLLHPRFAWRVLAPRLRRGSAATS